MAICTVTNCKWFNQDHAGRNHVTLCQSAVCRDVNKYHVGETPHVTLCSDVTCRKFNSFHVGESPHEYPPPG